MQKYVPEISCEDGLKGWFLAGHRCVLSAALGHSSCGRLTGLRGWVVGGGQEPTGRGLIGGGDQHANALNLQRRLLSSGIVRRHDCSQAIALQHSGDQFRLDAAGNDRHRHTHDFVTCIMRGPCHP